MPCCCSRESSITSRPAPSSSAPSHVPSTLHVHAIRPCICPVPVAHTHAKAAPKEVRMSSSLEAPVLESTTSERDTCGMGRGAWRTGVGCRVAHGIQARQRCQRTVAARRRGLHP